MVLGLALAAATFAVAGAAAPGDVIVTRNSAPMPQGCAPAQAAALVEAFLAAAAAGDRAQLDTLLAAAAEFERLDVAAAPAYSAEDDRGRALALLVARHARRERLSLLSLAVFAQRHAPTPAGGYLVVRREADDLAAPQVLTAKVGIDCSSETIAAWVVYPHETAAGRNCPAPAGWSGAVLACTTTGANAPTAAPGFLIAPSPRSLPRKCAVAWVKRRVFGIVGAFDAGLGDRFLRGFARSRISFEPYDRPVQRRAIASFVSDRYRRGDGWTATRLSPPVGRAGLPAEAVYGVELRLSRAGAVSRTSGAKVVVDCRSGLVRRWVGPVQAP
jgi:hypothetical protein